MDTNKKATNPNDYSIPKTLSQSIYNYVKNAIINNDLKANQKINEKDIAQRFQVSTTPVREAVLRLGAEGFVRINSHRESLVREISYDELKEIFQVLGLLDSMGSSLAADNLSQKDLKDLEALTSEMERHCHIHSLEEYIAINQKIHKKIWGGIPNKFLHSTIDDINEQMLRYNYARFYAFRKPGVLERSMQEHKKILEALKERDKKKLKNLIVKHWGSLLQPSPFEEGLKEYLSNEEKEVRITERKKQEENLRGVSDHSDTQGKES